MTFVNALKSTKMKINESKKEVARCIICKILRKNKICASCVDFLIADDIDELIKNNKTDNLTSLKSYKSKDNLTHVSMKIFKLFIELENIFQELKENLLSSKLSITTICNYINVTFTND